MLNNEPFKTDSLSIEIFNTSRLQMNVAVDFLQLKAANQSIVNLNGSASFIEVTAQNAGRIEAENLIAKEVDAYAGNASYMNIHASEKLSVNISSAGRINYLGQPQITKNSISSAGQLNSINPSE